MNKSLAKTINQLHISETSGRGVPKITSFYGEKSIAIEENSIRVTIPFIFISRMEVGDKAGDKLNLTQKRMLELIRDNPSITQPTLTIELRLRKTAMQNNITFLRKNGYTKRIGSNKSGYWEAIGEKE